MIRPTWHDYFFTLAYNASKRSTCDRLHVGAVIVNNNSIISTGYNGSLSGVSHCDDKGHLLVNGHCVRTIHAEINAILQTTKYNGIPKNSTIYITHSPCIDCFKTILATNIKFIRFKEYYKYDDNIEKLYKEISGYKLTMNDNYWIKEN